jgi:hypothetical protein
MYVRRCMHACMHANLYMYMYVYMYMMYTYVCTCICVYVSMIYIYICVCIYILYVYIYICICMILYTHCMVLSQARGEIVMFCSMQKLKTRPIFKQTMTNPYRMYIHTCIYIYDVYVM